MDVNRRSLNQLPRWFIGAAAIGPASFLTVFYAWPFVTLVMRGLNTTSLGEVFSRRATWDVLWFTCWQAAASTALTVVIGMAPTWVISRFDFPGRRAMLSMLTAVFVLPTVVVAAAFMALLPDSLDHSIWAILGAHVAFNIAVVVRVVGATWEQIPRQLEHASTTLGASPFQTFRHITLPLLYSSLVSAVAIVFLFTFTSFGIVRVLGNRSTIEVEVWRRATQLGDIGGAAVLAVVQLIVLVVIITITSTAQRRYSNTMTRHATRSLERIRRPHSAVVVAIIAVTLLVVGLPLAALIERSMRSGDGYSFAAWRSLGSNEVGAGLRLAIDPVAALMKSATTAMWATGFSVLIAAAAVIAITTLGRSGRFLDSGLMLPLGTSGVTVGFGMLITFDINPFDWRASWWLVPVGHSLIAVPFIVRGALGVLRSVDPNLADAAATLGAPPWRAWASTTLPFLVRPLASGAGLAAAISLGEFGATSFLSRSGSETIPIVIERLLGRTGSQFQAQAFALSAILAATTIGIVVLFDLGGARAQRR